MHSLPGSSKKSGDLMELLCQRISSVLILGQVVGYIFHSGLGHMGQTTSIISVLFRRKSNQYPISAREIARRCLAIRMVSVVSADRSLVGRPVGVADCSADVDWCSKIKD